MRSVYTWLVGLTLAVSPSVGFAPQTVHVRARAERGDTVVLLIDDGEFYRRTDYPNDGKMHEFDWRDVPAGEHVIHLLVFDHGVQVDQTSRRVAFEGR